MQMAGLHPRLPDSGGLAWGLRICISNEFLGVLMLLAWGPQFEKGCLRVISPGQRFLNHAGPSSLVFPVKGTFDVDPGSLTSNPGCATHSISDHIPHRLSWLYVTESPNNNGLYKTGVYFHLM